jgi:hypothetical protein
MKDSKTKDEESTRRSVRKHASHTLGVFIMSLVAQTVVFSFFFWAGFAMFHYRNDRKPWTNRWSQINHKLS